MFLLHSFSSFSLSLVWRTCTRSTSINPSTKIHFRRSNRRVRRKCWCWSFFFFLWWVLRIIVNGDDGNGGGESLWALMGKFSSTFNLKIGKILTCDLMQSENKFSVLFYYYYYYFWQRSVFFSELHGC